jgi:hypothetical protein
MKGIAILILAICIIYCKTKPKFKNTTNEQQPVWKKWVDIIARKGSLDSIDSSMFSKSDLESLLAMMSSSSKYILPSNFALDGDMPEIDSRIIINVNGEDNLIVVVLQQAGTKYYIAIDLDIVKN